MLLVDGHVHIYDCFEVGAVFDAAEANFAAAAAALDAEHYEGVLCLVASRRERFLETVRARGKTRVWRTSGGFWDIERTAEREALVVTHGATRFYLIVGRQIVTRERLEVLALGTRRDFAEHEPTEATLREIEAAGALAVLPWGVGKWLGARGAIIDRLLASREWSDVHLGDNGNRLEHGPEPIQFVAARGSGRYVLPGSDPLPLAGEERRIGTYGFAIDVDIDVDRPTATLLSALRDGVPVTAFGHRTALPGFVGRQLALMLKDRFAARSPTWA